LNDDGSSGIGTCSNVLERIGRLPWATIGAQDLRDASGERLWYAVSSNFRKFSGTTVINSDTPGLLTVTGTAPANNVVAVIIAPGDSLSGQDRQLQHNNYLAYLEGVTLDSPAAGDSTFNTVGLPTAAANDRLIAITQAELMAAVEPVVAARIERDIKPYITGSYKPNDFSTPSSWWTGGYPFAAPFVSGGVGPGRTQDQYIGDTTPTTQGLMPVSRNAMVAWDPASVSVADYDALDYASWWADPDITSANCGASTAAEIVCVVDYSGSGSERPGIRLRATLLNAGTAFLSPASKSNTSITEFGGLPGGWSTSLNPNPDRITNVLLADGNATVTFYGRLTPASATNRPITIRVAVPAYHPLSNSMDPQTGWFIRNEWYRQTYYAVSQGWVPGGGASCTAGGTCLTVNNLPPSYATSNDKRLILVFAGRALDGSMRPTNNLANYFELENSVPNVIFQHHPFGLPTTINDRVVVVSP
jgi:hypothetical protein